MAAPRPTRAPPARDAAGPAAEAGAAPARDRAAGSHRGLGGLRHVRRHPADLLRVLVGGVVVVAAGGMAAQRGRPFAFDADLLRLVNGLPAALGRPLLVVMQLGALALASCLAAFKVQLPLVSVVAVYLVAAAVAAASPLPGGLVAMEAALVVGLTAAGAPAGPAVAGVLAFRLVTFWLPILPGWLAYRSLRASGTI